MNVSPWYRPPRQTARPCFERLEDRVTPTTHNLTTGPLLVGDTLLNGPSSNNLLDIVARTAQPLASPIAQTVGGSPSGGTTAQTPTMLQAWQSLFLDGASLETQRLFYQFVQNVDEFPLGSTLPDSIAKAAASGIDFNAVLDLSKILAGFKDQFPNTLFADIEFNLQYAGPFGLAVGVAGASAANQAVQIPPMSSPSSD